MKKVMALALLAVLGMAVIVQAQPDPRDSVIFESKTVHPGARAGSTSDTAAYVYLKMYITNKDTLVWIELELHEYSVTGGAYMTLGWPRTFNGVISRLTNTLNAGWYFNGGRYHSDSPDSFALGSGFDPLKPETFEPPNPVRKAFWEMKFDTVKGNLGTVAVDTGRFYGYGGAVFTNTVEQGVRPNFVKSIVTVKLKGDLNLDGEVRPSDVVLLLWAVYLGEVPPAGISACDVNCDGQVTSADFTAMLNFKYLGAPWPC